MLRLADIPLRTLGPAPGAESTPEGDPALMPLGPEPCAQCLGYHARTLHLILLVTFPPSVPCYPILSASELGAAPLSVRHPKGDPASHTIGG
jgi:hypothetical protein